MTETLTEGQLHALRNLAHKQAGQVTPFLNIADALRLTRLGFAGRTQQGWHITPAGAAHLASLQPTEEPSASISPLHPSDPAPPEGPSDS